MATTNHEICGQCGRPTDVPGAYCSSCQAEAERQAAWTESVADALASPQAASAYRASVESVDSFGYVAYEIFCFEGEWHVTHDPDGIHSASVWASPTQAMREATRVNNRLIASLSAAERHNYLSH